jgi:uncharacterized protein with HEPN domain
MSREWRLRIEDILEAISNIGEDIGDLNFDAFLKDRKTRNSVVRELQIIGEAARYIPLNIELRYSAIPWKLMRGMRNVVVHEYFGVDWSIIWQTAQLNLPPLVSKLQQILEES